MTYGLEEPKPTSAEQMSLSGAIEAMLFVTDEPVSVITLAQQLGRSAPEVEERLKEMEERFAKEDRGIELRNVAGGWRFYTKPAYRELLEGYVLSWDSRKLSQAALETLAIVAYGQPITRAAIATIRGVNSESPLSSLLEKGLVCEMGTQDSPGNPILYGTTRSFLERFDLASTKELPPLEAFAPDRETVNYLQQALSTRPHFIVDDEALDAELDEGRDAEGARAVGDVLTGANDDAGADEAGAATLQELMCSMMQDALASSAGLVEKINFDELEFEE